MLADVDEALREALEELTEDIEAVDDLWVLCVEGEGGARPVIERAVAAGAQVISVTPARETLEDLFVRDALAASSA